MYRFVLSRRWVGFALFVVLLAGLCVRLGLWQLHRLEHRLADNKIISTNLRAEPVGIDTIDGTRAGSLDDAEYTRVRVTGTYDADHQVVLKYQTRDAGPGADILTPLVTDSGRAVLVDRGWIRSQNNARGVVDVPAPPSGPVTVTGWWRQDSGATGNAVEPQDGQVRAISSVGVATGLDYPLYRGYLNLRAQEPSAANTLAAEPRPAMGQGPHFFYAMQWFFFAGLAIVGWFYFAWSEAHPERSRASRQASQRAQRTAVDREHGAGDVRSRG